MQNVTTLFTRKGGVGKTSIILNLIWLFQQAGKRVLAIDLDSQGNLSHALGCFNGGPNQTGLNTLNTSDLFEIGMKFMDGEPKPDGFIFEFPYGCERPVCLIPTNGKLAETETKINQWNGPAFEILTEFLDIVQSGFDYILLDCSSGISAISWNALFASDKILSPLQMEELPMMSIETLGDDVARMSRRWKRESLGELRFIPNMVQSFTTEHKGFFKSLHAMHGDRVTKTFIPYATHIKQSQSATEHGTVFELKGCRADVLANYRLLHEEVFGA